MSSYLTGSVLRDQLENPLLGQEAIVEGLIFKDTINLFYSEPGAGKSVIAVNMLASMSGGWPVFGLFKMKRFARCSYLQLEGSTQEQLGRLKEMISHIPVDYANIAWHTSPLFVESQESQHNMMAELLDYKPEVIFIDSFYCLTGQGLSNEKGFLAVRQLVKQIKDKTGATINILHHSAKPTYDGEGNIIDKSDPFLGSQYMKAFVDLSFYIKRIDKNKVSMKVTKESRNAEAVDKVTLEFDKLNWIVRAVESETTIPASVLVTNFLKESFLKQKDITTDDIAKATGLTKRHILRLKRDGSFSHLTDIFVAEKGAGKHGLWLPKKMTPEYHV